MDVESLVDVPINSINSAGYGVLPTSTITLAPFFKRLNVTGVESSSERSLTLLWTFLPVWEHLGNTCPREVITYNMAYALLLTWNQNRTPHMYI